MVKLRQRLNLPGMRVLQFGFEALKPNLHSPHNYPRGCAAYTGTHDNDTAVGWYRKADPAVQDYTRRYLGTSGADIAWDLIRAVLASPANIAIVPAQDLLSLDSEARMNTPGTIDGNWQWRCPDGVLNKELSLRLAELTSLRTGLTLVARSTLVFLDHGLSKVLPNSTHRCRSGPTSPKRTLSPGCTMAMHILSNLFSRGRPPLRSSRSCRKLRRVCLWR